MFIYPFHFRGKYAKSLGGFRRADTNITTLTLRQFQSTLKSEYNAVLSNLRSLEERNINSLTYLLTYIFIAHARYGHISTSSLKSDVIIVFLDPISYNTRKFRRFAYI